MAINRNQFAIDRASRLLNVSGWEVIGVSTEGPTIRLTARKPKPEGPLQTARLLIDQVGRILSPQEWQVVAMDLTGADMEIIVERPKEAAELPKSPIRATVGR